MSAKEKIYEIAIQKPLTPARRKAISQFLDRNAHRSPIPMSYYWDEDDDHLLHVATPPVRWELWFDTEQVTVYGSGPFWAKLLFTKERRAQMHQGFLCVFQEVGLIAPAAQPRSRVKRAR